MGLLLNKRSNLMVLLLYARHLEICPRNSGKTNVHVEILEINDFLGASMQRRQMFRSLHCRAYLELSFVFV